jgi:hypothetical protein
MKFKTFAAAALSLCLLAATGPVLAKDRTERVRFKTGATSITVKGRIKGYDTMHYLVGATAGQVMDVTLKTKNTSTYFNVFAPGKMPGQDEAMFIGDTGGDHFEGVLPDSGDYLIQVYLYRNAARKGETSKFNLKIGVAAGGGSRDGGSDDALVPGTDFNATGQIPCARNAGQPMNSCDFGVKRDGDGNGAITVFWPDGGNRVIFYEMKTPSSYDQSEADGRAEMTVDQNAGLYTVTIGEQRFEIPDVVMAGD